MQKSATPLSIAAGTLAALALAAGCSGQPRGAGAIPSPLEAPAGLSARAPAGTSLHATAMVLPAVGSPATISITIQTLLPPAHAPHVVALGFELDGKAKSFVPLNLASKACAGKKGGALSCRVKLETVSGPHWLAVYGYKNALTNGKKPAQKPVATNGMPLDLVAAAASLQLAMYSPIASLAVSGVSAGISGSAAHGFEIDRVAGPDPSTFAVIARNAAKKIVIGPSTAAFALARS
ncbi:MAG TPA: hypothetical protein VK760_02805, partial [Candidatus Acidoferrales bacterium]|nr:hypothetical protein [Candidatus Acidoferrales bacterium]